MQSRVSEGEVSTVPGGEGFERTGLGKLRGKRGLGGGVAID
jgi:hypothetical protein